MSATETPRPTKAERLRHLVEARAAMASFREHMAAAVSDLVEKPLPNTTSTERLIDLSFLIVMSSEGP